MTHQNLRQLAYGMAFSCRLGARMPVDQMDDWQRSAIQWRCVFRRNGRAFGFDFFQGQAHTEPPEAEDCLDCLLSEAVAGDATFEEFCLQFGCDTDSRKAERVWLACQKTARRLRAFLGADYETWTMAERS